MCIHMQHLRTVYKDPMSTGLPGVGIIKSHFLVFRGDKQGTTYFRELMNKIVRKLSGPEAREQSLIINPS